MANLSVTRRQVDHRLQKYFETGDDCLLKAGGKEKFLAVHVEWVKMTMLEHKCELELPELKRMFDEFFAHEGTTVSTTTLFKILKAANIRLLTRKVIRPTTMDQKEIDETIASRKKKAELVL